MIDTWFQTKKLLRLNPETPVLMRDLWGVIKEVMRNIQLSSADGRRRMAEAEIDFGSTPVVSKKFTIMDASITTSSLIMVSPSGNVATSRVGDDWEWDSIVFSAKPNTGTFTLTANASGKIRGKRKILYTWQ